MKVLGVIQGEQMASSRIRLVDMAPHLAGHGVTCEIETYPASLTALARLVRRTALYDLVWLQKKLPGIGDTLHWRYCRTPVVFDFDDAICFRKEPKGGSYRSVTRERRFRRMTGLASAVTCGNRYLAGLVPQADKPVLVYPSPVPLDVPRKDYRTAQGPWVLGWVGGKGNLPSLERILPELEELHKHHDFLLCVVSDGQLSAPGIPVENLAWSLEGQSTLIAQFDVGLMPLDGDSLFDKGKCSYKVLQYMAAGVVSVADAVGMNAEILQDGENGCLVSGPRGWARVLDELLGEDRMCLARLGEAGRVDAERVFSYEHAATALAEFFRAIIEPHGRSRELASTPVS
ncbi:MAG: glycosyltransferase [Deferrisomatales bacterium]|nr:glycosyltransferase [Deferrisomatales bacterium]